MMNNRNIHPYCNDSQYQTTRISRMTLDEINEKSKFKDRIFRAFVKELIGDNAEEVDGTYQIDLSDLSSAEQKEYLKQYLFFEGDIEAWEEIVVNPDLYVAYLEEYKESLNFWLNEYADEVYCDHMESEGNYSYSDDQTGERLWRHRG